MFCLSQTIEDLIFALADSTTLKIESIDANHSFHETKDSTQPVIATFWIPSSVIAESVTLE
jgi:hypothetical protein